MQNMKLIRYLKMNNKLYGYKDIDSINYDEVKSQYINHINPVKAKLLSVFKAGKVIIDRAEGSYIYEKSGNKILDMTGGYGVLNHGHNHPRILEARRYCLESQKLEVNKNFMSQGMAALCNNLSAVLPKNLNKYFFPNSGSESVDMAMRICLINAKHDKNKNVFLVSSKAFHGKSLGPQALGTSGELEARFAVGLNVEYFDIKDLSSLAKFQNRSNICGIFIEPFSASTMTEVGSQFLVALKDLAKQLNAPLVFDEIYSGWCKTGPLFNFMRTNVSPDMLCFAKSLGGGKSSIAGIAYTDELSKVFESDKLCNYLSSTYYGFFEETVTAAEAIKIAIDEKFEEKASLIEHQMNELSGKLQNGLRLEGKGALWGLFFDEKLISKTGVATTDLAKKIFGDAIPDFKKLFAAAMASYIYKAYGVLVGVSFGYNTHLIISFNFSCGQKEIDQVSAMLVDLDKKSGINGLLQFVIDYIQA